VTRRRCTDCGACLGWDGECHSQVRHFALGVALYLIVAVTVIGIVALASLP
jgi:hypothetical protein